MLGDVFMEFEGLNKDDSYYYSFIIIDLSMSSLG